MIAIDIPRVIGGLIFVAFIYAHSLRASEVGAYRVADDAEWRRRKEIIYARPRP